MPLRVIRSASPGPAPTSTTRPASAFPWDCCSCRNASCSAWSRSFFMAASAAGPENICSQNALRVSTSGKRSLVTLRNRPAKSANFPNPIGSRCSSQPRTVLDNVGDWPILETATNIGQRSTIAGKITLQRSVRSTQLIHWPLAMAILCACSLTPSALVAQIVSTKSSCRASGVKICCTNRKL